MANAKPALNAVPASNAQDSAMYIALSQSQPIYLDVQCQVAKGETLAIVGPSGGGKSTILRTLAGLYQPAAGQISVTGRHWFHSQQGINLSPQQRRVGMVFQSYALFPHLTALENVCCAMAKMPSAEQRQLALSFLQRVRLGGLADRLPAQLSGGQRQRVAVARALARDPDVLLMDEPFSAVDRATRIRLQRELVELRQHLDIPIIIVTHDLEEAARVADRIAVLHEGRILQCSHFDELSSQPNSASVARLIGIRNIFRGELVQQVAANSATAQPAQNSAQPSTALQLGWGDKRLEITNASWPKGSHVNWCIPEDGVVLHRRDRPSRGEHENPLTGHVKELFKFGQTTELVIDVADPDDNPLHCAIPSHVAKRNGIAVGVSVGVSLKADMIHLMALENTA